MATNVKVTSRVSLQCRVSEIPDYDNHPHKEGKQTHHQWDCKTSVIDMNEWKWRFETAKKILCSGLAVTVGYYTGDVIGGNWNVATALAVNEDKFNER